LLCCLLPFTVSAQTLPPVNPATVTGDISTAGSGTLARLTDVIATRFGLEGYLGTISVVSDGTASAFQQFCSGTIDVVLADRQITQPELNACTASGRSPIAFRIATDAVVLAVNRQNNFALDITSTELQQIFSTANTWADVRPAWPAQVVLRFGPGSTSEEFVLFASALFGGDTRPLATAIGAQYNDDLNLTVQGIATQPNAIGFLNYDFAVSNSALLQLVAVDSIQPTAENIARTAYPLSRPLILYSAATVFSEKPQVASFINYYLTNAPVEIVSRGLFEPPAGSREAAVNVWLTATGQAVEEPVQPTEVVAAPTEVPQEQPPAEQANPQPEVTFDQAIQSVLINNRLDLEALAEQQVGAGSRPEGWSGSIDINDPQLPILQRLDLELLAALVYGADQRPADWFGAVPSTQAAISRDIRHDLEVLADTVFGQEFRPANWTGDNPLYRCDRVTQALVQLLQRAVLFSLSANPADSGYCQAAALEVALFTEVNLLQNNAGTGDTGATDGASTVSSAKIGTDFAIAFLNRNATEQAGVIPLDTQVVPVARSYVRFSNMMLVQGDGFLLFVEYQNTNLTAEQFDALPDESATTYDTTCTAAWCTASGTE
jgi:phosphate transport system substrate-binding protein